MSKLYTKQVLLCAASALFLSAVNGYAANLPPLVDLIAKTSPAVVAIGDKQGLQGSGFRLASSQLIITAAHVVSTLHGDPEIIWNNQHWPVQLVRVDNDADLAILKLTSNDVPVPGLSINKSSTSPKVGEWIVVLGCPFGTRPTATIGIISAEPGAVLEPPNLRARMQLNAAVNPGNSGGPVVTEDGLVVGVANATIPGGYGLGFAIPASVLDHFISTP